MFINTNINFSLVNDVEIVPIVSLIYDVLPCQAVHGEHGVEYVASLVLVQMREENVLLNGFRESSHRFVVLGDHLRKVDVELMFEIEVTIS